MLKDRLPPTLLDKERDDMASLRVGKALTEDLRAQDTGWHTFRNSSGTTYVRTGR